MNEENEKNAYEMIDVDELPFDRAYSLEELLPVSHVAFFFEGLSDLGLKFIGILLPDRTVYFTSDHDRTQDLIRSNRLRDALGAHRGKGVVRLDERQVAMPLVHQFETLAFLVMEFKETTGHDLNSQDALIVFVVRMLHQAILSHYKNLMTSGLHSQVIRESYGEIRLKNELLEKSEKKYRLLAERLEKEVIRKSEEIKEVHTHLMHQEKLASIGHLAAGVAHEINNPMGFITSNLRTLKDYAEDLSTALGVYHLMCQDVESMFESGLVSVELTRTLKHRMEEIRSLDLEYLLADIPELIKESTDGAERINKIVSDLKDFAHPGEEAATTADLIECIESTLRIVWNELKYKANVIKTFEPIPLITCFPRQLNQVIMNLLVNSVQAIEKRGDIEIRTRDRGEFVELIVRDTGQGIADEHLSKIFDPFFTTKDVGKGTGLGLNLVYNIVKKHKGHIHVSSSLGKGTTFVIKLPVRVDL